jgi:small-conductance mechanosensitive channel
VQVNTRDGVEYLIPNETFITERLANMSHTNRSIRLEIKFGVSYASDPHLVRRLAIAVVAGLQRVMTYPEPVCHLAGFGDSSLDFVLRFWIQDPEKGVTNVRGEAFLGLWDAFKENAIEIPYPHREVLLRSTQTKEVESSGADRGST